MTGLSRHRLQWHALRAVLGLAAGLAMRGALPRGSHSAEIPSTSTRAADVEARDARRASPSHVDSVHTAIRGTRRARLVAERDQLRADLEKIESEQPEWPDGTDAEAMHAEIVRVAGDVIEEFGAEIDCESYPCFVSTQQRGFNEPFREAVRVGRGSVQRGSCGGSTWTSCMVTLAGEPRLTRIESFWAGMRIRRELEASLR